MEKRDRPSPAVPKASAARLSLYLRHLERLRDEGATTTSSRHLGTALGVTAAQVRKDLGYFGQFGYPGIGYKICQLVPEIRRILGTDRIWNVALVGVGHLGSALVGYRGFEKQGFRIVALFDDDPRLVGKRLAQGTIRHVSEIPAVVPREGIQLGILTVPAEAAQSVADLLVRSGIRGIFNLAPVVLSLPDHIGYVSIDLTVQLEQLSFFVSQLAARTAADPAR